MKILLAIVAILATLSKSEGAQTKQPGSCDGMLNIRDFSHCVKKRQACNQNCNSCNSCSDCGNTCADCSNDCQSCEECEQSYYPSYSDGSYQTSGNNQNNVDIPSSQTNENSHQNKVTVNLLNTVHNLNKINTPIEIENNNHFSYDSKSLQKISSPNSQANSTLVENWNPGYIQRPKWQSPCCGGQMQGNGFCSTRTPMILPPYIPPPPPCYYMPQMPYFSCNVAPAPVIVPACAPCFYCNGKFNPTECSKKKECKEGCKKLQCGNASCYPQLQTCGLDNKDDDKKDNELDDKQKIIKT